MTRDLFDLTSPALDGTPYIYGAGRGGQALRGALRRLGRPVGGFIDSARSGACLDLPVIKVTDFLADRPAKTPILIASDYVFDISRTLRELGADDVWNANAVVARLLDAPSLTERLTARVWPLIAPWFAPIVRRMAVTGAGTDACLALGCLPTPVHFYTPIPDLDDLRRRGVWDRRSALAGIDFNESGQTAALEELGRAHGDECRWPATAADGDPAAFYTDNPHFTFGCAAAAHCVIRRRRPRRVIEIGSGHSSRVIAAALAMNARDGAPPAAYTVIDPFPGPMFSDLPEITTLRRVGVETVDPALFDQLAAGDVLFIDSGHTVRIGGDVNFLILDVLPRLAPGVIIHIHDIPMPWEYAQVYAEDPARRLFWTESYLVQAFLAHNRDFRVLLAMNWLMRDRPDAFAAAFPAYDPGRHPGVSHSLWLERAAAP